VKCPNCDFSQPPSLTCNKCGIIFSKFQGKRGARPAVQEGADSPEPGPTTTSSFEGKRKGTFGRLEPTTTEVLDAAISTSAIVTRVIAGMGAMGIAILMFQGGAALTGFLPYALMCCYLGAGLWSIATVKANITIRQFAIEITALVLVSAIVRILYPQIFSVDHNESRQSGEILVTINDHAQYLAEASSFEMLTGPFLSPTTGTTRGSRPALDQAWMNIRTAYTRAQVYDSRKAMEMSASYRSIRNAYEHLSRNLRSDTCGATTPCQVGRCSDTLCKDADGRVILGLPEPEQAIVEDHLKRVQKALEALRTRGEVAPDAATTPPPGG